MSTWIRVEDRLPGSGVPVIAWVPNRGAGGRRIRAEYAAPKTLELHPECEPEEGSYDEDTDTYWCSEGWYESNEYEEIHWKVSDPVTHWMPLPAPPFADGQEGEG